MAYTARVFRILIASPSDVFQERNIVDRVILSWNYRYSKQSNVVLLPTRWENQVAPSLGSAPQDIINSRIVEDCDMAVGVFWTRIGAPTEHFEGGTVEELDKVGRANKIVMVYFSDVPINPSKIDVHQSQRLEEFKKITYPKGIIHNYNDLAEFERAFSYHLDLQVSELIESDKEENPSFQKEKFITKDQRNYSITSDYVYLLTQLKKRNPKIDTLKSTHSQILEKINKTLDFLYNHPKWNERISGGVDLNVFQEILEIIVPKLDKTKFTVSKLIDFLPIAFYKTAFQVFKSIDNNSNPKIGIKDKTKLHGYTPIANHKMIELHSTIGYKNLLKVVGISLPFDSKYEELIEFLNTADIKKQTRTEIQEKISILGFDTKQAINIFTSLKNINLIQEIDIDVNENKLFEINLSGIDNVSIYMFNELKHKIELATGEKVKDDILKLLVTSVERNL